MNGMETTLFLAEISDKMPHPAQLVVVSVIFWIGMFGSLAAVKFAFPRIWPVIVFSICLAVSGFYWWLLTSELDDPSWRASIIAELGESYITMTHVAGLTPLALTAIAIVVWRRWHSKNAA